MTHSRFAASSDESTLRPRGVQGALSAVPYLLGFHPRESVVVVLVQQRRVILTARFDIDDLAVDIIAVTETILEHVLRHDADGVLLVGYSATASPTRSAALDQLGAALTMFEADLVMDVVHVEGDRYRSLRCADQTCCPPEGKPYAEVLSDPVAAEAVWRGIPALADREELRVAVRPLEEVQEAFVAGQDEVLQQVRPAGMAALVARMAALADAYQDSAQLPDQYGLGQLFALCSFGQARDEITRRLTRSTARSWLTLWSAVARASFGQSAACPLALAGLCAWLDGDGALLVICVEEAQKRWPDHEFVALVAMLADRGIHPNLWSEFRDDLLEELGELGDGPAAGAAGESDMVTE